MTEEDTFRFYCAEPGCDFKTEPYPFDYTDDALAEHQQHYLDAHVEVLYPWMIPDVHDPEMCDNEDLRHRCPEHKRIPLRTKPMSSMHGPSSTGGIGVTGTYVGGAPVSATSGATGMAPGTTPGYYGGGIVPGGHGGGGTSAVAARGSGGGGAFSSGAVSFYAPLDEFKALQKKLDEIDQRSKEAGRPNPTRVTGGKKLGRFKKKFGVTNKDYEKVVDEQI